MTNQAKHTPGPWRIGDAGNTVFGQKTDKPSPETVATIGRNKANARLIAAAPELLLVAEMVLELATIETPSKLIDAARSAIAKAEGAQS